MRVLIIANSLECYGSNNSMVDMAIALKELGVDIMVLLPGYGDIIFELQKNGIDYRILPYFFSASIKNDSSNKIKKLINNLMFVFEARKIVVEDSIDLIHTNASNVDFGALLSELCNIPHVWHFREILDKHYALKYDFPIMERILISRAECVISISKYVSQQRKVGKNNVVIYNGLDLKKYSIDKEQLFNNRTVHILYCGQITKEKGVMDAVKAMRLLVAWGYENFRLDIVGSENDYCNMIYGYIKKHRLEKYIVFYGYQKDVRSFRKKANIELMCSRSDALGRVTIEGMLGECFMIGANKGGTLELIEDGKTGFLYEAGNSRALAEKIMMVYQDKKNSIKIVKQAKVFAKNQFDNKNYARKIYSIYSKCLKKVET